MALERNTAQCELFLEDSSNPGVVLESLDGTGGTALVDMLHRAQSLCAISTSDAGGLGAAITAVTNSARGAIIVVDDDETLGASTYTVPANCELRGAGGVLTLASGTTLNVQGPIVSDVQIFAHSVITTPGTLTVATETLDPTWWGATGDGSTDDADALLGMQACALDAPTKRWVFDFPAGRTGPKHFCYTKNWWMKQIPYLTVRGNGNKLECISSDTWGRNFRLIHGSAWIISTLNTESDGAVDTINAGMEIDSASASDRSVTVSTPADMASVSVGDWVMIAGYNQQAGGWPYNLRYAEFRKVRAVNGTTGVVSFSEGLQNDYRSDWADDGPYSYLASSGVYWGKARLYHCNKYAAINEFQRWENCRFVRNRNQAANTPFNVIGAIRAEIDQCDFMVGDDEDEWVNLEIGACQRVIVSNSNVWNIEADKLCEDLQVIDCEGGKQYDVTTNSRIMTAGTGVTNMGISGCRFHGNLLVSPRQLTVKNSSFSIGSDGTDLVRSYTGNYPTRSVTIENVIFNSDDFDARNVIAIGGLETFTVDAIGAGHVIKITRDAAGLNVMQLVEVGMWLYKSDLSVIGKITAIYADGTHYIIETDAADDWQAGDTVECLRYRRDGLHDLGGCVHNGRKPRPSWAAEAGPGRWFSFTGDQVNWATFDEYIYGYVLDVRVSIERAYTGSAGSPYMRIVPKANGTAKEICRAYLDAAGTRIFSPYGSWFQGSDTHTPENHDVFCDQLVIEWKDGGSTLPVNQGEMPSMRVSMLIM